MSGLSAISSSILVNVGIYEQIAYDMPPRRTYLLRQMFSVDAEGSLGLRVGIEDSEG